MRVPFFSRMSAVEVHENVVLILGGDSSMDATVSKSNDVFLKYSSLCSNFPQPYEYNILTGDHEVTGTVSTIAAKREISVGIVEYGGKR